MPITAPYNFVPLNKEVFYPSWSEQVSHDIPLKDGESGEIEITITAKSPIFIRNHYKEGDNCIELNGKRISTEFCHFVNSSGGKEYYIPSTSIKGMIRNVLEIMSFGKMRVSSSLSEYLTVRDMTTKDPDMLYGKANGLTSDTNFGYGILNKTDNGYTLEDYGNKIRLILQRDLKLKHSKHKGNEKDVSKKYSAVSPFTVIKVKLDPNNNPQKKGFFDKYTVIPDDNGEDGQLFFGGHFGKKHYEFVLLESDKARVNKAHTFTANDTVIKKFKTVYFDNQEKDNYVGNYWRGKTKIPVFYIKENGNIKNIGLTQLFKLAYDKTLADAIYQNNDDSKLDLAETIFGSEKEKMALKGRVFIGHFKCENPEIKAMNQVEQVLGNPKPSYYPNYIAQTGNIGKVKRYLTLMDKDAIVSGWKRYPLQNVIQEYELPKNDKGEINHDVTTKFKPLPSNTVFKGKVRFHNLIPEEIGALLSAITFHGRETSYFHNIGMAKPLGYGKISIKLAEFKYLKHNTSHYLEKYKTMMDKFVQNWETSSQLTELFAMANTANEKSLRYQMIENQNPTYYTTNKDGLKNYDNNDFTGAKKAKEYLTPYSGKTMQTSTNTPSKNQQNQPKTAQNLADTWNNR